MFTQPELAPISRMLAETGVTDLVINGFDSAAVLVGGSWRRVESGFGDESEVDRAARLLMSLGGRQVDFARPFGNVDIDGRLRVHALLASAVNPKTHISIRVHAARAVALEQLAKVGMFTFQQLEQLRQILLAGESFLISGSAGAGKTTLLRAMLIELNHARIITIEDVAELCLPSTDCVSLVARSANVEGRGEIALQQLLTESLRMRPDRIVVGELRGAELIAMLQAINTGHSAAATIHANSITQVAQRLESIAIANNISADAARRLFVNSIDWLIHVSVTGAKRAIEIRGNHE
jgi:pilus assembly protein CpaF